MPIYLSVALTLIAPYTGRVDLQQSDVHPKLHRKISKEPEEVDSDLEEKDEPEDDDDGLDDRLDDQNDAAKLFDDEASYEYLL